MSNLNGGNNNMPELPAVSDPNSNMPKASGLSTATEAPLPPDTDVQARLRLSGEFLVALEGVLREFHGRGLTFDGALGGIVATFVQIARRVGMTRKGVIVMVDKTVNVIYAMTDDKGVPMAPEDQPRQCAAPNCGALVKPTIFMCRRHFFQIPKPLQKDLQKNYRAGQEKDGHPNPAWVNAAKAAIAHVAAKGSRRG